MTERDLGKEREVPAQRVVIIMGSVNDNDHCTKITDRLDYFKVAYEKRVASAHKTPSHLSEMVEEYLREKSENNEQLIFITVAGLSNALSGHVKGLTFNANPPVFVVASPPPNERDIWSSVRMPKGVVVPYFENPENAALFSIEIFSQSNPKLADDYERYLQRLQQEVTKPDSDFNMGNKNPS